ncbi:hypothetical protein RMSM_03488 [Rhodopirellula maiorica SM1]|uniref:Uncharacterized protein n=1 Tax=Rhodopirellula maiorica SM1 TaxID=1265738 RepID=M5RJT5_9BACT|nr:hypothetical protein RMSM_03488 [Rhodopirellula maiorica SM1]
MLINQTLYRSDERPRPPCNVSGTTPPDRSVQYTDSQLDNAFRGSFQFEVA